MKKVLHLFLGFFLATPTFVFAANDDKGLESLNQSGAAAKNVVANAIHNWKWIFALLPFGVGIFVAMQVKNHLEMQDERSNGQNEPKISRWGKIVGAFIGGVIIMFILYGILGKVFADMSFADMWKTMVTDFWYDVLNPGGKTAASNP